MFGRRTKPFATTFASSYYPHRYQLGNGKSPSVDDAIKAIPECAPADGWAHRLFPIADPAYSGGADPKEDRIVMIAEGTKSPYKNFAYCLAATHRGQDNAFNPCTQGIDLLSSSQKPGGKLSYLYLAGLGYHGVDEVSSSSEQ
jgi:hypothetical protein